MKSFKDFCIDIMKNGYQENWQEKSNLAQENQARQRNEQTELWRKENDKKLNKNDLMEPEGSNCGGSTTPSSPGV